MASLSDLIPREMEVLQLVLAGKTNKSIAQEIYISEKTVEFHLNHIYTKIGGRTRLMAGVWALQHGMELEARGIPSSICSAIIVWLYVCSIWLLNLLPKGAVSK